jgi:hypothetical protein
MMIRLLLNWLPNFSLLLMLIFADCCSNVLNEIPIVVFYFPKFFFVIHEYLKYWIKFDGKYLLWEYGLKDFPTSASTNIATSGWPTLDLRKAKSHIVWFEGCSLSMYKMQRWKIVDYSKCEEPHSYLMQGNLILEYGGVQGSEIHQMKSGR